jgi:hypothetical protein
MIGMGDMDLDREMTTAGRGAGTAKPSGGGGERLRGTLSHSVLFLVGRPFFFIFVCSAEIIPKHRNLVAVEQNISQNN